MNAPPLAYKYNVRVKYEDGTLSVLSFKGRTAWSIRTAKKHLKDVTRRIEQGYYPGAVYACCTLD
jgi:hypothetical protein